MFAWIEGVLRYSAALVDGEGSLVISVVKLRRNEKWRRHAHYATRLIVTNTDRRPLDALKSLFGGSVNRKPGKNRPCYAWDVGYRKARTAVLALLPYLVIKRQQALLFTNWPTALNQWVYSADVFSEQARRRTTIRRLNHGT